ncbi:MAG: DUF3859 domain-containing protein [Pseudomonadales bacterium]|jgi:hypothetical protein
MDKITYKIRNCLLTFLFLLGSAVSVQADVVIRAAEITAFGIFQEYGKQFERGYNAAGPGTDSLDYVRFVDFTNEIPGEVGISFGIQYIIHSTPKGKPFKVTGVIIYPDGGLVTPEGEVYSTSKEKITVKLGVKSFYGFGFDKPWEVLPGEWTFQIKHNDAILAQKKLLVLPPEPTLSQNLPD